MRKNIIINSLNDIADKTFVCINYIPLISELSRFCRNNTLLIEALSYFGEYEILMEANLITEKNILNGKIFEKSKVPSFFLITAQNVLRNKIKLKSFKEFNNLTLASPIEDLLEIADVDIDYLRSEKFSDTPLYEKLNRAENVIEKMKMSLDLGNFEKFILHAKYFKFVIENENDQQNKMLLNGILLQLKANMFFNRGKLNIALKHVRTSIKLFESTTDTNYSFLASNYNLLATIDVNQGRTIEGMKLFEKNLDNLYEIKKDGDNYYGIDEVIKEAEISAFMFRSNTSYPKLDHIISKVFSDDDISDDRLVYNLYARAYLLIDNNLSEKAIKMLDDIHTKVTNVKKFTANLNLVRYLICEAEALTCSFKNSSRVDLDKALKNVIEAKELNKVFDNNYFHGMINILEGYITENNALIVNGLNILKYHNYNHYHDWYQKKTEQATKKGK